MTLDLLEIQNVIGHPIQLDQRTCRGIRLEIWWHHDLVTGSDWILN